MIVYKKVIVSSLMQGVSLWKHLIKSQIMKNQK